MVVSLGSNNLNKMEIIEKARIWLSTLLEEFRSSEIYLSPAVGNSVGEYANCVISGNFEGSLDIFDNLLKDYEKQHGRDEACRNRGEVPIDIDIVIYGEKILKTWDYRQEFFKRGFHQIFPQH